MRKPILPPSFSRLRIALLGLAALMMILAFLPAHAQPVFTQQCNGFIYCTDWGYTGDCCYVGGHVYGRQSRDCTDGLGNYCTEYRCTTGPCPV